MPPIWKPQENKTILYYIDTILEEASDELNDWETNFITSVEQRARRGLDLSQRQEEILEKIYAEKTK